jgi:hypothetical protein
LAFPPSGDVYVASVMFVIFVFFAIEIAMATAVISGYTLSLFFWCDVIGTLALIPDFPWINASAVAAGSVWYAVFFRAGRIARVATRLPRLVRLVRLARLRMAASDDNRVQSASAGLAPRGTTCARARPSLSAMACSCAHFACCACAVTVLCAVLTEEHSKLHDDVNMILSRRIIAVIIGVLLTVQLFDFYSCDSDHLPASGLSLLVSLNSDAGAVAAGALAIAMQSYVSEQSDLLWVRVGSVAVPSATPPDLSGYRSTELVYYSVAGSGGGAPVAEAYFSEVARVRLFAEFAIGLTLIVAVIFLLAVVAASHDFHNLFVEPLFGITNSLKYLAAGLFGGTDLNGGAGKHHLNDFEGYTMALRRQLLAQARVSRAAVAGEKAGSPSVSANGAGGGTAGGAGSDASDAHAHRTLTQIAEDQMSSDPRVIERVIERFVDVFAVESGKAAAGSGIGAPRHKQSVIITDDAELVVDVRERDRAHFAGALAPPAMTSGSGGAAIGAAGAGGRGGGGGGGANGHPHMHLDDEKRGLSGDSAPEPTVIRHVWPSLADCINDPLCRRYFKLFLDHEFSAVQRTPHCTQHRTQRHSPPLPR